ncbi:MAG TPA: tRNA epoxyqueuosine(34) reductase QueG [Candidatus Acidoferrum sp.]|nr:tRNA epoxyqueuosine(34) reductase QueG [Candidatus Acidoferrum sp.]
MSTRSDTIWVESRARELGFDLCGIVSAKQFDFPELRHTQEWLKRGFAGEMQYLADPRRSATLEAFPEVRSVIVCALNYNTDLPRSVDVVHLPLDPEPRAWISRYAWGDDYHQVLLEKLSQLTAALRERFTEAFDARVYTDTGPLQERIFAKYAGLGWLGKNTLLLNQRLGSWIFLGAVLTTLDLLPSLEQGALPPPDLCGSCRRCIDACPTQAFVEPYVMDARRCISYLTIELRGPIPHEFREPMGSHVFGCDICQDVCPWNRRSPTSASEQFRPRIFPSALELPPPEHAIAESSDLAPEQQSTSDVAEDSLFLPRLEWLAAMNETQFRRLFRGSAMKRTKWRGLLRNACIALGNAELHPGTLIHHRITGLLRRLSTSQDALVAESALWALTRIE